jgi:hypothetical protein
MDLKELVVATVLQECKESEQITTKIGRNIVLVSEFWSELIILAMNWALKEFECIFG